MLEILLMFCGLGKSGIFHKRWVNVCGCFTASENLSIEYLCTVFFLSEGKSASTCNIDALFFTNIENRESKKSVLETRWEAQRARGDH